MNTPYKLLFLLLLLLLWAAGCEKDTSPTETNQTEKPRWQVNEYFLLDNKILLNSTVSSGNYYVAGLLRLSMFDGPSLEPAKRGAPVNDQSLTYKPAMQDHFIMYRGSASAPLILNSAKYYNVTGLISIFPFRWGLQLHELDSAYSEEARVGVTFHRNYIGAFNDQNQFLAFIDDGGATVGLNVSFCLIDLNPQVIPCASPDSCLELSPQLTRIPYPTPTSVFLRHIDSYKDRFFAYVDGDFLIIYSTGQMRSIPEVQGTVVEIFDYQGNVYAVTEFPELIYISQNEGETWSLFAANFFYAPIRFFTIRDKLCFYVYSQIAMLDVATGAITELDNSGLEGHEITSVNEYHGRAWVTTLSGMFYKDINDFFTPLEGASSDYSPRIKKFENLKMAN